MIRLQSVRLDHFKGVAALRCALDDFTLLVGLNNSGKTTVLQAAHLLVAGLPAAIGHQFADNPQVSLRTIDLSRAMSSMGFPSVDALRSAGVPQSSCAISADFTSGLQLELRPQGGMQFIFTLASTSTEPLSSVLTRHRAALDWPGSEFVLPPGTIATREDMLAGPRYQTALTEGKGGQLWRNDIWWSVQSDGPEGFAAVEQRVTRHFPNVRMLQPSLDAKTSPPDILIRYQEGGGPTLDIAQSGSGLRTFLTLSRLLEQSRAQILLLDEPDAHLHASQQATTIDLLMDAADSGRQIIIASHAPEFVSRVPREAVRWIEAGRDTPVDDETFALLERLGTSPHLYVTSTLPDVVVFVEGSRDVAPVEALIKWVRRHSVANGPAMPTTRVIAHGHGWFEASELRAIVPVLRATHPNTRVVGIRDRDWRYGALPAPGAEIDTGDGYALVTLGCKELENLFCDPNLLAMAAGAPTAVEHIRAALDEESAAPELLNEWRFQVLPRVRACLPAHLDAATREQQGEATFNAWRGDAATRRRLVAGKDLLARVRERLKREGVRLPLSPRVFESAPRLTAPWLSVAGAIFPNVPVPPPLGPP